MPTYGGYNDPNIAQAASNLAGLFKPPSAQEVYASGKAQREAKDFAARQAAIARYRAKSPDIADMFVINDAATINNLGDLNLALAAAQPDATPNSLTNLQIGAGKSYRDTAPGTAFIEGQANARNAADNQRAVAVELVGPLSKDQTRQDVTAIADLYGLPKAVAGPQMGIQERDPGKDYVLPDGTTVAARMPGGNPEFTPGVATIPNADGTSTDINAAFDKRTGNWLLPGGQTLPAGAMAKPLGTSGGMSLEVGKDGTVKLVQGANGLTNSRNTDLQRMQAGNDQVVKEGIALYRSLGAPDLGVAGVGNELATTYGAQVAPGLARPDVMARRTQLQGTTAMMIKQLASDERLSDGDRRAIEAFMISPGMGESEASAKAKLSALIALSAYRSAFANRVRAGGKLPDLNAVGLGKMVDEGIIPADIADNYAQNVLAPRANTGAPGIAQGPAGQAILDALAPASAAPPPAATADPNTLRAQAQQAIQSGADPAAVSQRFKQMTGQDL